MSNATLKATRWYAAGPGGTYSTAAATSGRPVPVLHAKEPGGTETRCGLPALRWSISWALPFDISAGWACGACADLLARPDVRAAQARDLLR